MSLMPSDDKKAILEAIGALGRKTDEAIDNVGRMVANVVETMATKDDIAELRDEMKDIEDRLSGKITNLQSRVDVYAGLDRRVESMDKRLVKVEAEVGIV